jgi:hypothetical protein
MKFHGASLWLSIHSYCNAVTEPDAEREVDVASHHPIRSFIHSGFSFTPSLSLSLSLSTYSLLPPYPFHDFVDLRRSKRSGTVFLELSGTARGVCVALFLIVAMVFASGNCTFLA